MSNFKLINNEACNLIEKNGYLVLKEFLSENEVSRFKKYILQQFRECSWKKGKTFGRDYKNYCTSWLFKRFEFVSARLYIQEHNRPDFLSKKINDLKHDMLLIEKKINNKKNLKSEKKRNFFDIVSIYSNKCSGYPPHKDIDDIRTELQAQQTLTKKIIDYNGGDLVLHFKDKKVFTTKDLDLSHKDIIIFDKSIVHSVESINPGKKLIGRWMVLYNASIISKSKKDKSYKLNSLATFLKKDIVSRIRDKIAQRYINKLQSFF